MINEKGGKTLVLVRKTNVLRIYEGIDKRGDISYTAFYNITGLKSGPHGWYDIYSMKLCVGFVSNVENVKEKW